MALAASTVVSALFSACTATGNPSAASRKLFHAIQIDRRQPAPEGKVNKGAGLGGFVLGVEGWTIEGRRMGVERHLGHGRRATDRAGGRAGCPAFPTAPPRFVEVNVDVDDARKDVQPAGMYLLACHARDLGEYLYDAAVTDRDVRDAGTIGSNNRATTHEKIEPGHLSFS